MTLFFFNNFFVHIVTVTKMFQVSCELKSLFPATKIVSSSIFNSLLQKFSNVLLTCFSPGRNFQLVKNFPAEGRSNQKPKKWTQTNSKIQSKPTKLFNCSCKVHKSSNEKKKEIKKCKSNCFELVSRTHGKTIDRCTWVREKEVARICRPAVCWSLGCETYRTTACHTLFRVSRRSRRWERAPPTIQPACSPSPPAKTPYRRVPSRGPTLGPSEKKQPRSHP